MASRFRTQSSTRISFFAFQDIITSVSGILILVVLILACDLDKVSNAKTTDANPELEHELNTLLEEQTSLDVRNQQLRAALSAARDLPNVEQIEHELETIRVRVAEQESKVTNAFTAAERQRNEQLQRDVRLGLSDLANEIDATARTNNHLLARNDALRQQMNAVETEVKRAESAVLKAKSREGQLWLIPDARSTTKEPVLVTVAGSGVMADRFDRPNEKLTWNSADATAQFRQYLSSRTKLDQYLVFLVRPSGIPLFNQLSQAARLLGWEIGFDALEEAQQVHFSRPPPLDAPEPVEPPIAPSATNTVSAAPSPAIASATNVASSQPPPSVSPPTKESWWQRFLRTIGLR